jgi:hypothetical protein
MSLFQLFKGALHRQCFNDTVTAWSDSDISTSNPFCSDPDTVSTCDVGYICRLDG